MAAGGGWGTLTGAGLSGLVGEFTFRLGPQYLQWDVGTCRRCENGGGGGAVHEAGGFPCSVAVRVSHLLSGVYDGGRVGRGGGDCVGEGRKDLYSGNYLLKAIQFTSKTCFFVFSNPQNRAGGPYFPPGTPTRRWVHCAIHTYTWHYVWQWSLFFIRTSRGDLGFGWARWWGPAVPPPIRLSLASVQQTASVTASLTSPTQQSPYWKVRVSLVNQQPELLPQTRVAATSTRVHKKRQSTERQHNGSVSHHKPATTNHCHHGPNSTAQGMAYLGLVLRQFFMYETCIGVSSS